MKRRPFFRWLHIENTLLDKEWLRLAKELEEANISKEEFKAMLEAKKCEKEKNQGE
jgi:hypothetical protein